MPDLYLILILIVLLILVVAIIILSSLYFEIAVLAVILSPLVSAAFYQNTPAFEYIEDANIGTYIRLGLLLGMGVVGIIKYVECWPVHKGRMPFHIVLLAGFISFALLSTIYSIDKTFTLVRSASFLTLGCFLLGFDAWLQEKEQFEKTINMMCAFIIAAIVITLLELFLFPSRAWWWSEENRLMGVWDHPNAMGAFCMVSYFVLFFKLTRTNSLLRKSFIVLIILMVIVLHFFTGSRTSLFASGTGVVIWFLFHKKVVKTLIFVFSINILIFIILQIKPPEFLRQPGSGIMDLSGREDFWQGAMVLIAEKPFLGYGYGVDGKVWQDARFYNPQFTLWKGSAKTSLHNGYISVAIGVGIIVFILWCIILVIPLFYTFKLPNGYFKAFILSVLTVILISNITESAIQNGNSLDSIFFWIIWVMAGRAFKTGIKLSSPEPLPVSINTY